MVSRMLLIERFPVVFKNTIARFDIATLKAKALFDDIPSNRARRGPKLRARIVDEIKTVALDWYIGNKQLPGTLAVLCCFSVVIIQQSAQPLAALHRSRYFTACPKLGWISWTAGHWSLRLTRLTTRIS